MREKRVIFIASLYCLCTSVFAEKPDWVIKLPFADDAFFGVGMGSSKEEAQLAAKKDILMQLSSQVEAVISLEDRSNGGEVQVTEKLETFIGSNSLRGAELEDEYSEDSTHWALMKYCDECGKMLVGSALKRYEEEFNLKTEEILEKFEDDATVKAIMVERRLQELNLDDYKSEDITIRLEGKTLVIVLMNFLPYETDLSPRQQEGLIKLSETLLAELLSLDYRGVHIVGHANPTGEENEAAELIDLSRNRAETISSYFKQAGIVVTETSWMGGKETIGDVNTDKGKGRNRRVEIVISFE
jgi:outer membrane protein OmpA-like peptidoglycan-associated protein